MPAGDSTERRPSVAIVFYETYLGCAPSIINAARSLAEQGFAVDIFIRASADRFVAPPDLGSDVRVIRVETSLAQSDQGFDRRDTARQGSAPSPAPDSSPRGRGGIARWIKNRFSPAHRKRVLQALQGTGHFAKSLRPAEFLSVQRFASVVTRKAGNTVYTAVIGVDTKGLIAAHRLAAAARTPVVYWSLEIMFLSDFKTPMSRYLKRLERRLHQQSSVLVIQDRERQQALCDENRAHGCPTILVPNSPRGFLSAERSDRFFHNKFQLPDHQRVILHAGSVCDGMRSSDLAAAAGLWPETYRLVFHSHTPFDPHSQYGQSLIDAGRGRVLISSQPVDYDQLDQLVASASIGLVIYDNSLGPNFQLLAGASGKLAHYLRCGVPVISIGNPSIGRVLSEHGCGIGVDTVQQVLPAMEKIQLDEMGYRRRAQECYRAEYEFGKHFQAVVSLLNDFPKPAATT